MPVIDLAFPIKGEFISIDHGYGLFSALCRVVPSLHGDTKVGVHPIRGEFRKPGVLGLITASRLRLRLASEELAPYIPLCGANLEVDGYPLQIQNPVVETLQPVGSLASRLVTFRGSLTPDQAEAQARKALLDLEIAATPMLVPSPHPKHPGEPIRRVLQISGKRVVGYAMRVVGLTEDEALKLQEIGLGGRRRMGCGVFVPYHERRTTRPREVPESEGCNSDS